MMKSVHIMTCSFLMSMLNRKSRASRIQVAQTHRENLQKNLQRRLEAARTRGDENLVRLLEAEASYLG